MVKYNIVNYRFDGFGPSIDIIKENLSEAEVFEFFNELEKEFDENNLYINIFWGSSPEDIIADFIINPTIYEGGREEDYYAVVRAE